MQESGDEASLTEKLHEINQLHIEEATGLVNARDKDRHPDGHAFGLKLVVSMEQTLQNHMHLSNKMGAPRRKAFDFGGAREAMRLVHSAEYTEKILVCIVEAEEFAMRIFTADKERNEERLSRSLRGAVDDDDGAPGGKAMQSQDLNEVPAVQPQQVHQAGPVNSEFALAMNMIAESIANQNKLMMQQQNNKGESNQTTLFQTLHKAKVLEDIKKLNVDVLTNLTQREEFTLWIEEFFRIICSTVNGYERVWTYLSKLLKFTLVKPAKTQNAAAAASGSVSDSFFKAIKNGQHQNPVLDAELMQSMISNASRADAHQSTEDDTNDSDSNQLSCVEGMSGREQLMDEQLFPVLMHLFNNDKWKKFYMDAAQEDPSIKRASFLVFHIMGRMPQTVLEFAAAAKISTEKWKHMPFQTAAETQELCRMMAKGAAIRRDTQWMMEYLEILTLLQKRPTSQAGKRATQAFVELFETGMSSGDLRPAIEYFQVVQSVYLSETKTFTIGSATGQTPQEQNLAAVNRDLMRQLKIFQDKGTIPVPTVKAAVASAGTPPGAFQEVNKTCNMCNGHFLATKEHMLKHQQCYPCFKTTPAGIAKQAERDAKRRHSYQGPGCNNATGHF